MFTENDRIEVLLWTKGYPADLVISDVIHNHGLEGIRALIAHEDIPTHLLLNKVDVETLVREVASWLRKQAYGIKPSFKADLLKKAILEKDVEWLNQNHEDLQLLNGYRRERYTEKDRINAQTWGRIIPFTPN